MSDPTDHRESPTLTHVCRQQVVLDIGDDIGALIVYTRPDLLGREIEVSPRDNAARRQHTDVWQRRMGGRIVYAAVFAELRAGDYSLWRDVLTDQDVSIAAGRVSEVHWPDITDASLFRAARPDRDSTPGQRSTSLPPVAANILPARYAQGKTVTPTPMGAAPLRFADDGQVAWNEMWADFCDLALAGGPRHRQTVLENPSLAAVVAAPDEYTRVVCEIERGLQLVTGLPTVRSSAAGWVGLHCTDLYMARWLVRAIAEENVCVRRQGAVLLLPAAPHYRLEKEIKNVVTVVAKTYHYFAEHRGASGD